MDKKKYLVYAISLCFGLTPVVFLVYGWWLQYAHQSQVCKPDLPCDADVGWTTLLLTLPYVIQLIVGVYGLVKMNRKENESFMFFFCLLTFLSVFSYSLAWCVYMKNNDGEIYSHLCLGIIGILIGVLLILTFLFIHPHSNKLEHYRAGLKHCLPGRIRIRLSRSGKQISGPAHVQYEAANRPQYTFGSL